MCCHHKRGRKGSPRSAPSPAWSGRASRQVEALSGHACPPCPSGPAPRPHPAANTPAVRSNLRPRCETSLSPPAALFSVLTVPLPPPRGPLLSELLRDLPVGHPNLCWLLPASFEMTDRPSSLPSPPQALLPTGACPQKERSHSARRAPGLAPEPSTSWACPSQPCSTRPQLTETSS